MDLRPISADYAVAPQIEPGDMAALAEAGYGTVICNRPDDEVPPELQSSAMRAAAKGAGLRFVENPVVNGGLTMEMVERQHSAMTDAGAPVLAYCRSGTRSTIVWALAQAGRLPTDDIVAAAAQAGYDVTMMRPQIEALAGR